MSVLLRAALFVVALGAVFAAAFGVGTAFDDAADPPSAAEAEEYHVRVLNPPTAPAARTAVRFVIEDHRRRAVTEFEVRHEKRLHLIAVDTGYTGFQHLHPTLGADGVWSVPMRIATGRTQIYADFTPVDGDASVARASFDVLGPLGSPVFSKERTQVVDGYAVALIGDLVAGGESGLRFAISRDGDPVADLQPYLGAYGHLVMLRKADGAYLHVHPEDGPAGPEVAFAATAPDVARYHLYLDFKHDGKVRTAMFVLDAVAGPEGHEDGHEEGGHGDH